MTTTPFLPSKHGFHFPNGFVNNVISGPVPITTQGRCGGMAYASLDYYAQQNMPVPTCDTGDFPAPDNVPADGTPLADYIYKRLMDSFTLYGLSAINWYIHSDHSTLLAGPGIVSACKTGEWPKLKAHLDQGTPIALMLITASGGLGDCHQVVAYGYTLGPNTITISIYDNNYPDNDQVTISSTVDGTNPHWNEASGDGEVWRAWFCQDGTAPSSYGAPMVAGTGPGAATPPFTDITLTAAVQPSNSEPLAGEPFRCSFSVSNNGPYPAHATYLVLSATAGPNAPLMTAALGADTTSPLNLAPGESYTMTKEVPALNVPLGTYTLAASYVNLPGQTIENLPASGGQSLTTSLSVFAGPTAHISILGETPSVAQGVGVYAVDVSAIFQPSQFSPTSIRWTADPGTPHEQSAAGNSATLDIVVGPAGGPYIHQHTIQVVASDAAGDEVTAQIPLTVPQAAVSLSTDYESPYTKIAASQHVTYGTQQETIEACSEVLMAAAAQGMFAPIAYTWSPRPSSVLNGGSEAVETMNVVGAPNEVTSYRGQDVTLNATDAIGQSASASLAVSGEITIGRIIYRPVGVGATPPEPAGVA